MTIYNIQKEYINITNYSPFCNINEVSEQYRTKPFMLPYYAFSSDDVRPVHPDTFTDIALDPRHIDRHELVYPTSSFRTVYDPQKNVCYKLPLLRKITRGVRDLSHLALQRSEYGTKKMSQHPYEGFSILPEETHHANDPRHNYITRHMPYRDISPWFFEIASQSSSNEFQMQCMRNIIKTWMFYASHGLFLEYHTQNILVDRNANIYYRDVSDVMIHDGGVSDRSWCKSAEDALSISFDRTVCSLNLDHAFRYNKSLDKPRHDELKCLIQSEIEKYQLAFPSDYSLSFSLNEAVRIPQKVPLVSWRTQESIRPQGDCKCNTSLFKLGLV
ncbi:hypothetical protein JDN40_02380 [Rhodomicrobium vannielii ATCC 17100]|uniref:hypothetical protein n=1 Tax=Rhodomicrobium vannielii TaxID=1069 RepID=UPI0019192CFD|nr:hypothetical protein [Rhodomicrobium vannielii]MBJ7532962.1 hypothetical protein [Rhodomicrobium vannielii ATCC 17100]